MLTPPNSTDQLTGRTVRKNGEWWVEWLNGPILVDEEGPFASKDLASNCLEAV